MTNTLEEILTALEDLPSIVSAVGEATTTIQAVATTVQSVESTLATVTTAISDVTTIVNDLKTVATDIQSIVTVIQGITGDNQAQLRGPGLSGWEQLGFLTMVDALAQHLGQPPSDNNPQGTGLFNVLGTLGGVMQPSSGGFLQELFDNLPRIL